MARDLIDTSLTKYYVKHHHQDKSNGETDGATITPEAKPNNVFCKRADISSRMKNTKAEPSIVPSRGIKRPIVMLILYSLFYDAKILNIQFVIHTIRIAIKLLRTPALPVLMSLEAMQHRNEDEIVLDFQLGHD